MTGAEWAQCIEPQKMADFLDERQWGSGRKSQLFVCACVRRIWPLLNNNCYRVAVDLSEQAADGLIPDEAIEDAWLEWIGDFGDGGCAGIAALAATGVSVRWDWEDAHRYAVAAVAGDDIYRPDLTDPAVATELRAQADLYRDIHGNPFSPFTLATTHRTPTVASLARAAYDERHMPSGELDPHRLAVLADALEETGAPDEVAAHLRGPGPHVRGCWALDLALGLS